MDHQFQLLSRSRGSTSNYLAVCGPEIFSFSESGKITASWTAEELPSTKNTGEKRKLEDVAEDSPSILMLTAAPKSSHVCVVTEDKCIRVLQVEEDGSFTQISQRTMPKRPCAVAITEDNQTIVCSDKFGDCYSLPLLVTEGENSVSTRIEAPQPKTYKPTATEMTVHTQRNRKALEEQLRAKGRPTNAKEPLAFEHKLLLGHVSMLTDMQLATDPATGAPYIITCDRDEHIRVSRGIPQAHIIEHFCLGHTQFIHKLVAIPNTTTLLSAGGDDWMGVWDWKEGKLLAKHNLRQLQHSNGAASGAESRIAIQNIWLLSGPGGEKLAAVKVEGGKSLAVFDLPNIADAEKACQIVDCASIGDIIDLCTVDDGSVIASVDGPTRLHSLTLCRQADGKWELAQDESRSEVLSQLNGVEVARSKKMDELLHSVERLRKGAHEDD